MLGARTAISLEIPTQLGRTSKQRTKPPLRASSLPVRIVIAIARVAYEYRRLVLRSEIPLPRSANLWKAPPSLSSKDSFSSLFHRCSQLIRMKEFFCFKTFYHLKYCAVTLLHWLISINYPYILTLDLQLDKVGRQSNYCASPKSEPTRES